MTDKQIIIDGVDVSGCEHFEDGECLNPCETVANCEASPNCYYKRKEQEYEELRQYHNKCCEEFEKEKKEWSEKYNQVSRDFYNGKYCNKENCSLLKTKEQECEELKIYIESNEQQVKEVETLVMDNDRLINELDQLKAENEELKNFHINLVGVKECEIKELVKYKQALTEIKEIANKFDYWNNNLSQASEILHEIIEKISEVLDE